jgi:hypothetical protein
MRNTMALMLMLVLVACGPRSESPPPVPATDTSAPARATAADQTAPPRMVVVVVLDQVGAWVFDRYRDQLDADGAMRAGTRRGALYTGRYSYAATYTAVGHATISTGAGPAEHGVVANNVWDRAGAQNRSVFDDGQHRVLGVDDAFAGPGAMRVETVADLLHRATGGDAVIAALSHKDRGAIPGGGRHADLVLWYDKSLPGFTTSTFYAEALPAWLTAWLADNPIDARLGPWEPLDPDGYAVLLGPDDGPGEGDLHGFGTTFPHEPGRTTKPYDLFRYSPASAEHLIELAGEVVQRLDMGADAVPDLLTLSISTTDYVGHAFGPHSWEYLDNLIRVDRALGAFLRRLEAERGPIAVVITSDHGQAPNPQVSVLKGREAGRIYKDLLEPALDAAAEKALGPGDWVDAFVPPFVYLGPDAEKGARRDRVIAALLPALEAMPEVAAAYEVRSLLGRTADPDQQVRTAALSIHPEAGGDVFVVPQRWTVVDDGSPRGAGTSHGTPYAYDQEVPIVVWGPGVASGTARAVVDQRRVAATIAVLLGLDATPGGIDPLPAVAR